MADFDTVSKKLFKKYAQDFLQFVLGKEKPFEILEITDPGLETVEARVTDILLRVKSVCEKCVKSACENRWRGVFSAYRVPNQ